MNNSLIYNLRDKVKQLTESLFEGDLHKMVFPVILVDAYKPKFGDEKRTVVVSLTCKEEAAASDMVDFIDKGNYAIHDTDYSPAPDSTGNFLVFIELKRNRNMFDTLNSILADAGNITNITDWEFIPYTHTKKYKWEKEPFENTVPQMPHLYAHNLDEAEREKLRKRIKFLLNY